MGALQRTMDSPVPWNAGRRHHVLLVATLVREFRENVPLEERFCKVDERDLAHHELQKGPWFQVNQGS